MKGVGFGIGTCFMKDLRSRKGREGDEVVKIQSACRPANQEQAYDIMSPFTAKLHKVQNSFMQWFAAGGLHFVWMYPRACCLAYGAQLKNSLPPFEWHDYALCITNGGKFSE